MSPTSDPRELTGLIAAAHSPFDSQGELALDVVPLQAEHLRKSRVRGVFVAGATGEFSSMTTDERERLLEAWIACAVAAVVVGVALAGRRGADSTQRGDAVDGDVERDQQYGPAATARGRGDRRT